MHLTGQRITKKPPRPRCSFACDIMTHVSLQPNLRVLSGPMGEIFCDHFDRCWCLISSSVLLSPSRALQLCEGNFFALTVSPRTLHLVLWYDLVILLFFLLCGYSICLCLSCSMYIAMPRSGCFNRTCPLIINTISFGIDYCSLFL